MSPGDAPKRPRGRPLGSGKKDDATNLKKLARFRIDNPTMTPWAAIPLACGDAYRSETPRRRLNRKWKLEGIDWLEVVAKERAPKPTRPAGATVGNGVGASMWNDTAIKAIRAADRLATAEVHKALHQLETQASAFVWQEIHNSAVTQARRIMEDTAMTRARLAVEESPVMNLIRGLEESPVHKMIQEIHNSPALQAAREWESIAKATKPWI